MIKYINKNAALRKHKQKMKKRYGCGLYTTYRTNTKLHEEECREKYKDCPTARNGGYEYWKTYYLSGPRQFAKNCTNRAIRCAYRRMLHSLSEESMDDVQALTGADYEKMFDYLWTIY